MILIALAALLQPAAQTSPTGFYISSTPEVGAAIELDPDGKFLYALDYGAVSERGEGTWRVDGQVVRLTTTKMEGAWKAGGFADTPLRREGNNLLLDRYDITIRFVKEADLALPAVSNRHLEKGN